MVLCGFGFTAEVRGQEPDTHAADEGPAEPDFSDASLEFFEREVRPLLAERCFECHGPDADEAEGGFRMDSRAGLLRGGDTGPAVIPGKPDESLLIDAVEYGDLYEMPPDTRLEESDVAILRRWVAEGAPWPGAVEAPAGNGAESFDLEARRDAHWAWQPITSPPLPRVRQTDWPRQGLDYFVLARLEAQGLTPAPPADRATWLRRVYLDLVGLPPSPEEIDRFLHDDDPRARERVVDALLASPRFGERWARHWLDLVRYAETYGHEFDYPIHHAHRYRDYVIRAWNEDIGYDQWVMEHVAGDLLEDPRRDPIRGINESLVGTGFWFLGEATHAPVDVRGDEAGRVDNQIDVFSKTFLGLTVACARCHDHKFDAISTRDYYALAGYLQSSRRQYAMLDPGGSIADSAVELDECQEEGLQALRNVVLSSDSAASRFSAMLQAAHAVLRGEPADLVAEQFGVEEGEIARWVEGLQAEDVRRPDHPLRPWVESVNRGWSLESAQEAYAAWERASDEWQARREATTAFATFDDAEEFQEWSATGLAFGDGPVSGTGAWNRETSPPSIWGPGLAHSGRRHPRLHGVLRSPTFTITHPHIDYRVAGRNVTIRLVIDGYTMIEFHQLLFGGVQFKVDTDGEFRWHRQSGDLGRYIGHTAFIEVVDQGDGWIAIDEIRFSDGAPAPDHQPSPILGDVLRPLPDSLASWADAYGREWSSVAERFRTGRLRPGDARWLNWAWKHGLIAEEDEALARAANRRERVARKTPAPHLVVAMTDGTSEDERVHIRGNHRALGEEVERRPPEALGPSSGYTGPGSGRLALAGHLVEDTNPLTRRVIVNRLWHHLFGRGLVASVDNFGALGQPPTHPLLLDHLATGFADRDQSWKAMIRSMVLSSTYGMSSDLRPEAAEIDPVNGLWHRMPIRRMQAEVLRDSMLAISGRLDRRMYGESVPVHITPFMQGRGRPGQSGPLDGAGRRTLYLEIRRNFLSPMMLAYDAPIPFNTVGRRNTSNVPAQALIMMNNPFVVQEARRWGEDLLQSEPADAERRIERAYVQAFGRRPDAHELTQGLEFLAAHGQTWDLTPEAAIHDERVWADYCHVLWNVKEFLYVR